MSVFKSNHQSGPNKVDGYELTEAYLRDTGEVPAVDNENHKDGEKDKRNKRWALIVAGAAAVAAAYLYAGSHIEDQRNEAVVEHVLGHEGVRSIVEEQIQGQYTQGVPIGDIEFDPLAIPEHNQTAESGFESGEAVTEVEASPVTGDDYYAEAADPNVVCDENQIDC